MVSLVINDLTEEMKIITSFNPRHGGEARDLLQTTPPPLFSVVSGGLGGVGH